MTQPGKRKLATGIVLMLVVAAGWAWARRDTLRAWYHVRQLARASDADRDRLAERVAELDDAAVPPLLDCLTRSDETVCANARAALDRLGKRWTAGDARTAMLPRQVHARWSGPSTLG